MRRVVVLALVLAGCNSSSVVGVALTITFSPSIDDVSLDSVKALHIAASGDETYDTTVPLGRKAHRIEREIYRPRPSTLTLDLDLTALDVDGAVVAHGDTGTLTLTQDGPTFSSVTLGSVSGTDAGVDLAPVDGPETTDDAGIIAGYEYSRIVTVPHASIGVAGGPATLADYPVLVSFTDASIRDVTHGGHVTTQQGYDFAVTATGLTCGAAATPCQLSTEIDRYDSTSGTLTLWVRVPALNTMTASADTTFALLYGNPQIDSQLNDSTTTWNSDFRGVWHFTTGYGDSTRAHDGTAPANAAGAGDAVIGTCATFDGTTNEVVTIPASSDLDFAEGQDFTISAWVNASSSAVAAILAKIDFSTKQTAGYALQNLSSSWNGQFWTAGTQAALSSPSMLGSGWHHLSFVRGGGNIYLYEDGGTVLVTGDASSTSTANSLPLVFGGTSGVTPSELFVGSLDEIRIASTARPAAWLATDYTFGHAPDTAQVGVEVSH